MKPTAAQRRLLNAIDGACGHRLTCCGWMYLSGEQDERLPPAPNWQTLKSCRDRGWLEGRAKIGIHTTYALTAAGRAALETEPVVAKERTP